MRQNVTEKWVWTTPREKAARHVAEDDLEDERIAAECGVVRQTLARWKHSDAFMARVEEHRQEIRETIRRHGIAVVENRVKRLQRDWKRLQQIADERGASEEMQGVPGGSTGLLVKQLKGIGKGDDFQIIEQYAVDTGLLGELRAHEQQAAKELQQWIDKSEHRTDPEQLDAAIERELARLAGGTEGSDAAPFEGAEPEHS